MLKEWYVTIYVFLRFNTSILQIEAELDLSYRTVRKRVERPARALDALLITLSGQVEIDEIYVSAGLKCLERDQEYALACLSACGRGTYWGRQTAGVHASRSWLEQPVRRVSEMNRQSDSCLLTAKRSR